MGLVRLVKQDRETLSATHQSEHPLCKANTVQGDLEAAVDKALTSAESPPTAVPALDAGLEDKAVPAVKAAVKEPEKKVSPAVTRWAH